MNQINHLVGSKSRGAGSGLAGGGSGHNALRLAGTSAGRGGGSFGATKSLAEHAGNFAGQIESRVFNPVLG